jgi:hypothetical protein
MSLRRNASGVFVEHGGSQQKEEAFAQLVDPVEPLKGTCPGLTIYKVPGKWVHCSAA